MRDTATRVELVKERVIQKRRKRERRTFCSRTAATLLSLALLAGLVPAVAFATGTDTGKAMQLGTGAIQKGDIVYYGTCAKDMNGYATGDAIQWQVLDPEKDNTGEDGMFLLSKYLLEEVVFEANWNSEDNDGQHYPNEFRYSDAWNWCQDFVRECFASGERVKIKGVSKEDAAQELYGEEWGASTLKNDQAFFLSAREVYDYISPVEGVDELQATYKNKSDDQNDWWLRSPQDNHSFHVGYVSSRWCYLSVTSSDNDYAARPAINLDPDSILFVSAANGGKEDALDGNLTAVGAAGSEWKLTLKDTSHTLLYARAASNTIEAGQSLTVSCADGAPKVGDNEYVSVLLCDSSDNVLYYGCIAQFDDSGALTVSTSVTIPADLEPGSYTLKVFTEQCNGDGKTDYASDFKDIPLTVTQNTAAHAVTVETEGDGAASADPRTATQGQEVALTATPTEGSHFVEWQVTSGAVTIVDDKFTMPANDVTVKAVFEAHSYDQQVVSDDYLASAAACTDPAQYYYSCICGAKGTATFESGQATGHDWGTPVWKWSDDGKNATATFTCQNDRTHTQSPDVTITNEVKTPATCTEGGVSTYTAKTTLNDQEYSAQNDVRVDPLGHSMHKTDHMDATCTAPGKEAYYTCEACGKAFEDEAGEAEIADLDAYGVIPATGHKAGTEWESDGASHWNECAACGERLNEAAHSGGTATCMSSAACEVCGQHYGEKDPANHTGSAAWVTTEATHTKVYSCCQAVIETEAEHTWENGTCSVCQYGCQHQGGTATCSQLAQCELCGGLYGDYDKDNHKAAATWTQEGGKHYRVCEYGCGAHLDEAECSGGTATCTAKALCKVCGQAYGATDPANHTGKAVWTQTQTAHSSAYDCCDATVIAREAHEWEGGVCSECGYECQHSGGDATCIEQATCDICKEPYGTLGTHKLSLTGKVEPTCTAPGKEAYYTCEACGKHFEDEAGEAEIADLDAYGVIPATGHKAGTEWESDGASHWNECAACGERLHEAAHEFEWMTDKEATATEAGSRHEECAVCGYAKATVEIPATGATPGPIRPGDAGDPADTTRPNDTDESTDTENPNDTAENAIPQTGDSNNVAFLIAAALATGAALTAALTGTAIYGRKRSRRR